MDEAQQRALAGARSLEQARAEAAGCRACDLWRLGTQTVFGAGPPEARLLLVGEQPGDREDRAGEPFVGPAGRLLDDALAEAGIDRAETYLTNAVKHFKWRPSGKRGIHDKPSWSQVQACRPDSTWSCPWCGRRSSCCSARPPRRRSSAGTPRPERRGRGAGRPRPPLT